jgi:SHS2 domain-containing protein
MFSVVADPAGIESRLTRTVKASGANPEELLVNWLSELNFLHQTHGELYAIFDLAPVQGCRAVGRIRGERIDPRRHRLHTEVKGVTYHNLSVTQTSDGWRAAVIFDV